MSVQHSRAGFPSPSRETQCSHLGHSGRTRHSVHAVNEVYSHVGGRDEALETSHETEQRSVGMLRDNRSIVLSFIVGFMLPSRPFVCDF